jgi:hypothetical protein
MRGHQHVQRVISMRAACLLLCVGGFALVGCGGDMDKTSAKEQTGAPGKLLDGGAAATGAPSTSGGADAASDATKPDAAKTDRPADMVSSGAAGSGTGAAGAGAAGTAAAGTGGAGTGAAGTGAPVDACRACEESRCKIAKGLPAQIGPSFRYGPYIAYHVCFSSDPWTGNTAPCAGTFDMSKTTAQQGPRQGDPKSELCQAALKCIRTSKSMCETDFNKCYCGTLDQATCAGGQVKPNGDCRPELEDAAETTDAPTWATAGLNACGASGAASNVIDYCDRRCCAKECAGATEDAPFDSKWCVMPDATGAAGTSGAAGTGGAAGASGAAGTSGDAGTSGAAGTTGDAGTSGAAGAAGAGGTGAAGAGATGAAGTGAGATSLLENFRFLASTYPWTTVGSGAVASYSADDAEGSGVTGSLRLAVSTPPATQATEVAAVQCLPASAGAIFDVDVAVKVPDGDSTRAGLQVTAYPSDFCWGQAAGVYDSPRSSAQTWQHLSLATPPMPDKGVQSISVQLVTVKVAGHDNAVALFDTVVASQR